MKRLSFFATFAILLSLSTIAPCYGKGDKIEGPKTKLFVSWQKHPSGLEYATVSVHIGGNPQTISVVRGNLKKFRVEVVSEAGSQKADSTSALAMLHGAQAAINGSYFNVKKLTPATFIKDDGVVEGQTASSELFRTNGILTISNDGKLIIEASDSASFESLAKKSREAVAAGPFLLNKGKYESTRWGEDSFYTGRHPRSVIGFDGKWVYLFVADGRFPERAVGLSIPETAQVSDLFNLDYALNLDGGGSSTLYIEGTGVISHPYDNRRFDHYGQRIVPNALLLIAK